MLRFFVQPVIEELTRNEKMNKIFHVLPLRLQLLLIASWSFIKAHLNKNLDDYDMKADFDYDPYENLALFRFIIYVERIDQSTMKYWEKLSSDFEDFLKGFGDEGKFYSKFAYIIFLPR